MLQELWELTIVCTCLVTEILAAFNLLWLSRSTPADTPSPASSSMMMHGAEIMKEAVEARAFSRADDLFSFVVSSSKGQRCALAAAAAVG